MAAPKNATAKVKRDVKPRSVMLMYKGDNVEILGLVGDAKQALAKLIEDPTLKIKEFTLATKPRKPKTDAAGA